MDAPTIREQIANWIVMLNSPDFKNTDADLVREEMLEMIEINEPTHKSN